MSTAIYSAQVDEPGTLDVPVVLARWRGRELALAHTFRECGGAGSAEIEDILDATITALLGRSYASEEHLFRALRRGVKMRALRLHRDRAGRERILIHAAPIVHAREHERAWINDPERALIAREDDLIVSEFLAELTGSEREVFVLFAEGRSWRAIATTLALSERQARALTRSCEQKRQRFLALYLAGRLCGYRSRTIGSLLSGGLANRELALEQALAHLDHCRRCQTEHNTTAEKVRHAFDRRAAGFLPGPVCVSVHTSILDRAQALLERPVRVLARFAHSHTAGTRERVTEAVVGTGAAAKIIAGIAGVALLAGGTVALTQPRTIHKADTYPRAQGRSPQPTAQESVAASITLTGALPSGLLAHMLSSGRRYASRAFGPGHVIAYSPRQTVHRLAMGPQHEPSGFAYLGVPVRSTPAHNTPSGALSITASRPVHALSSSSGGPFTP